MTMNSAYTAYVKYIEQVYATHAPMSNVAFAFLMTGAVGPACWGAVSYEPGDGSVCFDIIFKIILDNKYICVIIGLYGYYLGNNIAIYYILIMIESVLLGQRFQRRYVRE